MKGRKRRKFEGEEYSELERGSNEQKGMEETHTTLSLKGLLSSCNKKITFVAKLRGSICHRME